MFVFGSTHFEHYSSHRVMEPWFFHSRHGVILARSQVLLSLSLCCGGSEHGDGGGLGFTGGLGFSLSLTVSVGFMGVWVSL